MVIHNLPIFLLLVYSAASFGDKRIPRRHTGFTRSLNVNHPPSVENYPNIPDSLAFNDQEKVKLRNRNNNKPKINKDDKPHLNITTDGKGTNLETRSVNHPPSHRVIPVAVQYDYEEDMLLKPKARSINISAQSNSKETEKLKAPEIGSDESLEMETGNKPRRRSQQVRKVKVNKSQLDVFVNETEMLENKITEREAPKIIEQVSANEPSVQINRNQGSFKRRKQLQEPVVPIIELENYVFAHSGDFHYSYEGGDGTKAFERGELKSSNGGMGSAVEGSFSYKDKDGNDFSLSYIADENGYRPVGAHLPTPPPIPPAIQRALDLLATKTTPEPITERVKTL